MGPRGEEREQEEDSARVEKSSREGKGSESPGGRGKDAMEVDLDSGARGHPPLD